MLAAKFPGLGDPLDWTIDRFNAGLHSLREIAAAESGDPTAGMMAALERRARREARAG